MKERADWMRGRSLGPETAKEGVLSALPRAAGSKRPNARITMTTGHAHSFGE